MARLTVDACWGAALGVVVGVVLAVTLPFVAGGRTFTVMSDSMRPAVRTGDLVITEPTSPREARVGDVVTFPDPTERDRLITHRLRSISVKGKTAHVVTKGDANSGAERWTVPADGRIGRVVYRMPRLGYAAAWGRSPRGRVLLVILPAIWLGANATRRIWREPRVAQPRPATEEA